MGEYGKPLRLMVGNGLIKAVIWFVFIISTVVVSVYIEGLKGLVVYPIALIIGLFLSHKG
jgi:hypothetical protein